MYKHLSQTHLSHNNLVINAFVTPKRSYHFFILLSLQNKW